MGTRKKRVEKLLKLLMEDKKILFTYEPSRNGSAKRIC